MGKKLNGRLFRVHEKLFHIVFSSCEGSFLAIIDIFGWVVRRFRRQTYNTFHKNNVFYSDTKYIILQKKICRSENYFISEVYAVSESSHPIGWGILNKTNKEHDEKSISYRRDCGRAVVFVPTSVGEPATGNGRCKNRTVEYE
jgi:hypothetical protein